ncbi:MAG: 2-oxoglutarate dehydrogenase E1 component, partial [Alphaproteobacteria bacterium]
MTSRSNDVSFLTGANATYLSELYKRFLTDPGQVDPEWREFFGTLGDDARGVMDDLVGPAWHPREAHIIGAGNGVDTASRAKANGKAAQMTIEQLRAAARDSIQAFLFIRMHRVRGHLYADLDPLGIVKPEYHPELEYNTYGFADADLDREIFLNGIMGFEVATLRQIVQRVRETYCAKIGVEYMHMVDQDQKVWIQERIEGIHNRTEFTEKGRRAILERLTHAETFEKFCDKRFTGTKRFGLDGGEATIPGLEQILKRGGQLGVKEIVIGMPHRGRLNVLSNMMGKPFQAIFSEFLGQSANPSDIEGSGDVKYHLGTSSDREFDGNVIHLSLTANPSHLEAVNPVVCGKVRAKQTQRGDAGRRQVMGLLMHGDAAFAGQGLVAETLDLSQLKGYRTGGTIHFIVNNQIGFTTNPVSSRSGPYCSDVAKIVQAPIFHVNGDDPEAVVHVARIASEYRHDFQQDVVIDMFCYRRHGHNEGDEPAFTQPLMYKTISKHPRVRQIYAERLEKDGVIARGEADKIIGEIEHRLEEAFSAAKGFKPNKADWLEGAWTGLEKARGEPHPGETGVSLDVLREVGAKLCETPKGFNVNSKIARQLKAKKEAIDTGKDIDWATAEALAFGSLLVEGTPVRLSGQDCRRGTFSQRHAVLVDQETEADYTPLANLRPDQALFEVFDSPLAEASVLGFEYGYSLAEPNVLVMWEAQFGDFSNGAQIIIDQFISSGESKWLR